MESTHLLAEWLWATCIIAQSLSLSNGIDNGDDDVSDGNGAANSIDSGNDDVGDSDMMMVVMTLHRMVVNIKIQLRIKWLRFVRLCKTAVHHSSLF